MNIDWPWEEEIEDPDTGDIIEFKRYTEVELDVLYTAPVYYDANMTGTPGGWSVDIIDESGDELTDYERKKINKYALENCLY
jgi:hypothetical protein